MHFDISIKKLAFENSQIIEKLISKSFVKRSRHNKLTTIEVVNANHVLADYVYGPKIATLVRAHDFDRLNNVYNKVSNDILIPDIITKKIDFNKIGLVIVRPELINIQKKCVDLIEKQQLDIIYRKKFKINFNKYWQLYHHGLTDPESYYDFPTRTLNYINKDLILLIITASKHKTNQPISDILNDIKGKQGTHTSNTLRGDLAFNKLKQLIKGNGSNFTYSGNIALDPIGAYRHLISDRITSDRAHVTADVPILFYAGQGVHIPNSQEISRDIRVLLQKDELESLIKLGLIPIAEDSTNE